MVSNEQLDLLETRVMRMLVEDKQSGRFGIRRTAFSDPDLFELEMKYVFEGNWVYLAHESQIPNPNDYLTTWIGRRPVVITRDKTGKLHGFINACAHRGAMLCRFKRQNKATFTCPFHGWTFSNDGRLLKIKDLNNAGYPEQFNTDGSHDLKRLARFETYRGFLFGSLSPDVSSLDEYLGAAKTFIDLIVDQAEDGIEVLRGASTYTYNGNWKLQAENGADGYHVSAVHWNYLATVANRMSGGKDNVKSVDISKWAEQKGGFYSFENGHVVLWNETSSPQARVNFSRREEFAKQYGEDRANWMVKRYRNLCVYPNVFLMDQMSTQIRVFRPIAPDKTEVTIYCYGLKGEPAEHRARRLRQYEDFFNASGMATPDDTEEFRSCQLTYAGADNELNDLSRGAVHWINGPDEDSRKLGFVPIAAGLRTEDEGLFVRQHADWKNRLLQAIAKERANAVQQLPLAGE